MQRTYFEVIGQKRGQREVCGKRGARCMVLGAGYVDYGVEVHESNNN